MDAPNLFFSHDRALRAPWRIAAFCLITVLAVLAASSLFGPILEWLGVGELATEAWIEAIGVLGGTAIVLRVMDNRPWSDVWMGQDAARPSLLALGFALGASAIGLPILVLIASHWLRNAGGPPGSWILAALRVTLFLAPAALIEELLTRGYILSVLRESWGWPWAIATMSVVFGAMHLFNAGVTLESLLLVTLAGFFLALVLYVTRSLYAAWMTHFAWNWTMAVLFHASVSGIPLEAPAYRYVDAGPNWATGGAWGPEGGLFAGLGMCAAIVFLIGRRRQSVVESEAPTQQRDEEN